MADKKISALTSASTPLAGTEVLPIVQSGSTVKATVANIVGAGTSPGSFTNITGSANAIISVTDNTNAALRITQLGTGNALLVEDSTNPDASPFVIDGSGKVIVGYTAPVTTYQNPQTGTTLVPSTQIQGTSAGSSLAITSWTNAATTSFYGPAIFLTKSASATVGTQAAVINGEVLGSLTFSGDDGATFVKAAQIVAAVDGTPGTNDMPGRLVFSTTADGALSPTERMRISSTGQTTISGNTIVSVTDNTNAALRITQLGTGNALSVEDSATPDSTSFLVGPSGQVGIRMAVSSIPSNIALMVNGDDGNSRVLFQRSDDTTGGPQLFMRKARGSLTAPTIVASGDTIGRFTFNGFDGTNYLDFASIVSEVDGTPGTNDAPGRLVFSTTADGASTPTEQMRINNAGIVTMSAYGVGTATFSAGGVISSVSDENYKIKDGVIADPMPMIMALETGYYYGKPEANMGDGRQLGFYAQNVRAAIGPEAAPDPETYTVTDEDGVETIKAKPWGYYDRSVLAVAIEAIKVQQVQITALTARIAALEAKCP